MERENPPRNMAQPLNYSMQSARSTASSLNISVLPTRSVAPTLHNSVRCSAASEIRTGTGYLLPVYPMMQPSFPNATPPSSRPSNPASELSNATTSLVDVDKIVRLRQLNNNVYLISKNFGSGEHHVSRARNSEDEDVVQIGVVVNESATDPQRAVRMPQSRGEQIPPGVQQLVMSLRNQVRELQSQMEGVEYEFQVRYHREMNMSEKVRRLVEINNAAAKFKCDQATQVDIPKSTAQCEQGVQTFGSSNVAQISKSDPQAASTGSLVVGNDLESSCPPVNETLQGNINGLHPSIPASDTDATVDPLSLTIGTEPESCSATSWSDPSSCEFEDSDDEEHLRRRSASSKVDKVRSARRKRKRLSISASITSIRPYVTPDSDFPSDHPFRRSQDISKPPKVPYNYCSACYEKTGTRMLGKLCSTCRFQVGRLRRAYIANKETKLPRCNHTMGSPKRHCTGCVFKAYVYMHNRRNPSHPLPVPKTD